LRFRVNAVAPGLSRTTARIRRRLYIWGAREKHSRAKHGDEGKKMVSFHNELLFLVVKLEMKNPA
jgi:hypothetical protein